MLPADGHVHSEWSWDARDGAMERTCARAVELGLPSVAFTEHADFTRWTVVGDEGLPPALVDADGLLTPPAFDAPGYLAAVERCRDLYPGLRILSGLELGEAHWHPAAAARLLAAGPFDRVLGSLHCLPHAAGFSEPPNLYRHRPAADVVRDYLAEVPRLVAGSDVFTVLAHLDYPLRSWPAAAGPFDPYAFQDEFRHALRALADGGRILEVNTNGPLHPEIVRWWREEGGTVVTFGSDAHDPTVLARRFGEAVDLVESVGFRPGRHPYDRWTV